MKVHIESATQTLVAGHACSVTVQNKVISKTVHRFNSFMKLTLALPGMSVDGVFITHSPSQLQGYTLSTQPSPTHLLAKSTLLVHQPVTQQCDQSQLH